MTSFRNKWGTAMHFSRAVLVAVSLLSLVGCDTWDAGMEKIGFGKTDKGRKILKSHHDGLKGLSKSAWAIERRLRSGESDIKTGSNSIGNAHKKSLYRELASMELRELNGHLYDYRKKYKKLRDKVWAEFDSVGLAESDRVKLWNEYWLKTISKETGDPEVLQKQWMKLVAHVSVSSKQLDMMIGRHVYDSTQKSLLPTRKWITLTQFPANTGSRQDCGIRFALVSPTKFKITAGDNYAEALTKTFEIVIEREFVLDNKTIGRGTKLQRGKNDKWSVQPDK
jgi:hypothetical protein